MSPRRATRGAGADLQDRLKNRWPKGRTASPPRREIILTPLNETYKGYSVESAWFVGFRPAASSLSHETAMKRVVPIANRNQVVASIRDIQLGKSAVNWKQGT
jgi:hypothetical protein